MECRSPPHYTRIQSNALREYPNIRGMTGKRGGGGGDMGGRLGREVGCVSLRIRVRGSALEWIGLDRKGSGSGVG